jgi:hypothetical protein
VSTGLRGWWRRYSEEVAAGPVSQQYSQAAYQLPSADNNLHFVADLGVLAWWGGKGEAPESLWDIARSGIVRRAEKISSQYRLTAADRVRAEINAALITWQPVGQSHVHARGQCVSVTADPDLVAAVADDERNKAQQLVVSWSEQRRRQQREHMCSLLLDPLQATAWWLLDNPGRANEVVSVAETFLKVQSILAPAARDATAGRLVDELLDSKDDAVRVHFVESLRRLFMGYEREDLAARLPAFDD